MNQIKMKSTQEKFAKIKKLCRNKIIPDGVIDKYTASGWNQLAHQILKILEDK